MMPDKSPHLIIYGGPASGKSTQSEMLAEEIGADLLKMGKVLRELSKGKSELAQEVAERVDSGRMVPSSITKDIVERFVKQADGNQIIFDGYPRNLTQSRNLEKILRKQDRDLLFIFIDVSKEEAINRIRKRAKERGREDDLNEQAIEKRFEIFETEKEKLFREFGSSLVTVEGDGTPEEVFRNILDAIADYE